MQCDIHMVYMQGDIQVVDMQCDIHMVYMQGDIQVVDMQCDIHMVYMQCDIHVSVGGISDIAKAKVTFREKQ